MYQASDIQCKAARDLLNCKSGSLGYNISICEDCGHSETHKNSCRNRNCPNCQAVLKELWVDKRRAEVIDSPYYHVVFTLPHELNPLIYCNQKLLCMVCSTDAVLKHFWNSQPTKSISGQHPVSFGFYTHGIRSLTTMSICTVSFQAAVLPKQNIFKYQKVTFLFLLKFSEISLRGNIFIFWIITIRTKSLHFLLPTKNFVIHTNGKISKTNSMKKTGVLS